MKVLILYFCFQVIWKILAFMGFSFSAYENHISQACKTKALLVDPEGLSNEEPDSDLLSPEIQPTIIGAEAFHCPVRNGKEWDHSAMAVRQRLCLAHSSTSSTKSSEGMKFGLRGILRKPSLKAQAARSSTVIGSSLTGN